MLLYHSALYTVARGLPGLINFSALVVYTRLLNPDAYGRYAMVVAGVGLFNAVLFHWLTMGLLRFLPAYAERQSVFLEAVAAGYLLLAACTGVLGIAAFLIVPDAWRSVVVIGVLLLWAQAWFEINLEMLRCRLAPLRYGLMSTLKALLALASGAALVLYGWDAQGPLLGMLVGSTIAALVFSRGVWRGARPTRNARPILREITQYGLPLTATFATAFILSSTDRFLLGWLIGADAAGLYAAGYDLTSYSLGTLMMVVNLAAYPLAVRALERDGTLAAEQQLRRNGQLLFALALPAAAGFSLCATNIAHAVLGGEFQYAAASLIPWIALSALLAGLKAYHLDLAFQLGKNTLGQLWVTLAAALINLLLNLVWIPRFGVMGAAYATVVAYTTASLLSWIVGRRSFAIPLFSIEHTKVLAATGTMALSLWPSLAYAGKLALFAQIALGALVYAVTLAALNFAGSRDLIGRALLRFKGMNHGT